MPDGSPSVFISYRGGDERWAPDLVYAGLVGEFGADAVFKAGFTLRAGDDYPPLLAEHAASCPVMLVCIGPRWLGARDIDGSRRLDDPGDWVRREIEISLRNGNHVIPLLLGNLDEIAIPPPEDLPADIAPMAQRQAFRLEPGGRLRLTLPDLADRIVDLVPGLRRRTPRESGGTINAKLRVGRLDGKATAVRASGGVVHRIDAEVEVDEVGAAGEAVTVDLLRRNGTG